MVLSDTDLQRRHGELVAPVFPSALQPASIDLHLYHKLLGFYGPSYVIDAYEFGGLTSDDRPLMRADDIGKDGWKELRPGESVLGSTLERVSIPRDLIGRLEGKSSLGRLFLIVHCTSGYVDPGFQGRLTLEISNLSPNTVRLRSGMPIAQISFQKLSSPVTRPYGSPGLNSKYQGSVGPVLGRLYERPK